MAKPTFFDQCLMVHPVYQSPFLSMSLRSPVTQQEHGDASRGRRQRGVHGDLSGQGAVAAGLHGQRGARVEAVPAEPEGEQGDLNHEIIEHTPPKLEFTAKKNIQGWGDQSEMGMVQFNFNKTLVCAYLGQPGHQQIT